MMLKIIKYVVTFSSSYVCSVLVVCYIALILIFTWPANAFFRKTLQHKNIVGCDCVLVFAKLMFSTVCRFLMYIVILYLTYREFVDSVGCQR